jgi:PAS domain S-box-containing protein
VATQRSKAATVAAPRVFEPDAAVLRAVFRHSPNGISVSALGGRWLMISDAYCRLVGYERTEVEELSFHAVTHPDDVAVDIAFVAAALAGRGDSLEREKRYVRKNGSTVWARTYVELIRNDLGEPIYFLSHVQDATEHRADQDRLGDSARTLRSMIDNNPALISVKNRDQRYTMVNREFERFFDLPPGGAIGLTDSDILPASLVARSQARDLAVLASGVPEQEEEMVFIGDRERVFLRARFPLMSGDGIVEGVCTTSSDITERRLEERLNGERLQCAELVYSALAENRMVLYGQPIVDLTGSRPTKFELLIRMRKSRNDKELLGPGAFLPAAERFDVIGPIDEWVIGRATRLAAAGHSVSVNVSAKTISDQQRVDHIEAILIASRAPTENLIFEITETAVADHLDAARDFVLRLRQLGCSVALDDFGVGHGTFTYLRHLPIDYLKIDMQFVRDLLSDQEDRQVVEAIISVARMYDARTIAEGVEDPDTLAELRRLGVDYVQGYWTGRPAPLDQCWPSTADDHPQGEAHVT